MPVTLRDVAARAGVSRSAVSRTFTPGASVSARTRAAVEQAAKDLGYAPSALASALTTGRTKMIGLVANNFRNPAFLEVFDQFTRGLQARGLRPLLVNLSDGMDSEQAVQMLARYSVDGVILASSTLPDDLARRCRSAGLPVVHSFGRPTDRLEVHTVGVDNRASGRLAGAALIARGYRRIAFLGGPEGASSTQDRLAGLQAAMADAGLPAPAASFAEAYSFAAGRAEMQRLVVAGGLAEAYFCGDDVLSIGAMSALADADIAVPGQVGILGFNDIEMAGWAGIGLTTIRQPIAEIIAASIDLVVASVATPDVAPQARLFDCSIIERLTLRPTPDGRRP